MGTFPVVHWTKAFCSRLLELAAHPLWGGQLWALATALQYAVVCRTNDAGPWPPEPRMETEVPFLSALRKTYRLRLDDRASPPFFHQKALDRVGGDATPWSQLFRHLETLAGWEAPGPQDGPWLDGLRHSAPPPVRRREAYLVTDTDLDRLVKALDRLEGDQPLWPVRLHLAMATACLSRRWEYPPAAELPAVHARALLHHKRLAVLYAGAEDSSEGSPSGFASAASTPTARGSPVQDAPAGSSPSAQGKQDYKGSEDNQDEEDRRDSQDGEGRDANHNVWDDSPDDDDQQDRGEDDWQDSGHLGDVVDDFGSHDEQVEPENLGWDVIHKANKKRRGLLRRG